MAWLCFSSWRHWLVFKAGRNFHFLNKWSSFGLLFFIFIFSEHDLAKPDSLDEIFWDIADLFAFKGVIKEERVRLFFLKVVNLVDFGVDNFMKVIDYFFQIWFPVMNVDGLDFLFKNGLKRLFPLINALNAMDGENSEMWDFLLESFAHFSDVQLFALVLFDNFIDFFQTGFTGLDRWDDFLHQWGFFADLWEFVFNIFKDFHWVVLPIEHFSHQLPKFNISVTCGMRVWLFHTRGFSDHWKPYWLPISSFPNFSSDWVCC